MSPAHTDQITPGHGHGHDDRSAGKGTGRGNTHTAYDHIRLAIVEGRYPPGQRLIEQRIAEEFELSRTPVREALRRLEAEGLVLSEPNRGAVVRPLALEDVEDLYGLRARLEAYATELSATRMDEESLIRLEAGIESFAEALGRSQLTALDRTREVSEANREIHAAILAGAQHARLAQLIERTVDVPLVFQAFRQFDRSQVERSHLFHQLIRDAIVARDPQRAGALMFEHVMQGCDVLLARLASHELGVEDLFGS